jgi:hypothetical protein
MAKSRRNLEGDWSVILGACDEMTQMGRAGAADGPCRGDEVSQMGRVEATRCCRLAAQRRRGAADRPRRGDEVSQVSRDPRQGGQMQSRPGCWSSTTTYVLLRVDVISSMVGQLTSFNQHQRQHQLKHQLFEPGTVDKFYAVKSLSSQRAQARSPLCLCCRASGNHRQTTSRLSPTEPPHPCRSCSSKGQRCCRYRRQHRS